jgi:hypothetical protein
MLHNMLASLSNFPAHLLQQGRYPALFKPSIAVLQWGVPPLPAQIPRSCNRRETLSTCAEASPFMGWTEHSTCLKPQSVPSNMLEPA